jgi:LysM repeat protein
VNERRRRELLHYGGPAAFLVAVTIALLLIKAGLSGSGTDAETTQSIAQPVTTHQTSTRQSTTAATTTTAAAARYYTIESGDTLGSVAAAENTTVEDLLRLNPGVDPQSLHVGQRIRVG